MIRRIICGLLIFMVSSLAFGQSSMPTASELAAKIKVAGTKANYVAVRRVTIPPAERGGASREVDERVIRSRGMLYISYSKDSILADQKIFERDGKRYAFTISTNELRVTPGRSFDEVTRLLIPPDATTPSVRAGERVAGRSTYLIETKIGRDRGTHRMWVDSREFVILKRNFLDSQGKINGGYEIIEIDFNARISRSKFELPKGAKLITVADDLRRIAKELEIFPFLIRASGFDFMNVGRMEHDGVKIIRQFYMAGEKRVSLFVMKGSHRAEGFKSTDRVKIYRWESGGHTLVLVGDMSEAELAKLAKSVKA